MARRVLVIDDDPSVRELVGAVLASGDIEVHEASGATAGLAALEAARPDVVVLDISMPGVDGWEALDRIRSLSAVPVLMLSAHGDEEDKVRALRAGADDYVAKPLAPAEFAARVEALMRRAPAPAPAPDMIGNYRLEGELGRGGMGAVYRARHLGLDRVVALKVLPAGLAPDPTTRERFIREWRTAASLRHPNIVAVHDAGEADGRLYLAMELIEGEDLATRIDRAGPLGLRDTVAIVSQVAAALDAAHAAGVVHRDVKPGNILLAGKHAWLTDFGLAKVAAPDRALSSPGQAVGTADYLAPEQVRNQDVGPATDVYALGCVIYEMLTGRTPFAEIVADLALLFAHIDRAPDPPSVHRPGIPEPVDAAVMRALTKDPAARFASAGALAQAVTAGLEGPAPGKPG